MTKPEPFLSLGFAGVDWMEHYLLHGPGDVQGQPIELDDELAAFVVKAYRVDPRTGGRKVRRAFLSRPKGRSKSGLAAMIECFEALGPCRFDHWAEAGEISPWGYEYEPGEPVGKPLTYVECLNVATEEGQAGNTYDAVYYMLNPETCSKALLADYGRIDVGLARTTLPNQRGFLEPITTKDTSKDGGKSTFIVADETHLWILPRLKRLHAVMTRNLLKRKIASGWMLETSTMYGAGENSVAEGTHAYAKSIESGHRKDRSLLFDHRQASEKWNLHNRAERIRALREAYGPAAAWMDLNALADSWDDPQVSEADYRRYWLNQPVSTLPVTEGVFGPGSWGRRRVTVDAKRPPVPAALGIAADVDQVWLSLGAASSRGHLGSVLRVRIDLERDRFVSEVARIQRERGRLPVAIDAKGPASFLIPDLEEAGVRLTRGGLDDYVQACADLRVGVELGTVEHGDYHDLNAAVDAADWRKVGERRVFARRNGEISMLEAVTWALWAARSGVKAAYGSPAEETTAANPWRSRGRDRLPI